MENRTGFIYKIHSYNTNLLYYGSTYNKLGKRLANHKSYYKRWLINKKKYVTSFKIIELDDPLITLVESIICNNRDELRARERWYIENNNCVNKNIPGRTIKEYYESNKDKYREYNKERTTNKYIQKYFFEVQTDVKAYYDLNNIQKKRYHQFIKQIKTDPLYYFTSKNFKRTIKNCSKSLIDKNFELFEIYTNDDPEFFN